MKAPHRQSRSPSPPFGPGQIQKQIAHHPPELAQGVGGGGGANQLDQEVGKQGMQQGQQGIPAGLAANDGGAVIPEGLSLSR
jgi:hypothetical protein